MVGENTDPISEEERKLVKETIEKKLFSFEEMAIIRKKLLKEGYRGEHLIEQIKQRISESENSDNVE